MSDLDELDLSERLSRLSGLTPTVEATQRAVRSARRTLARQKIKRWSIAGALAAAIAVMVVVGVVNLTPHTASAAEALLQAAHNTNQFEGWVHIHIHEGGEGAKDFSVEHINNQTGETAWESHIHGSLKVQMYIPEKLEEIKYDSDDNQVKIGQINQQFASGWKANVQNLPFSLEAALARVPGMSVRQSNDGALLRFDLTFPPDDQEKAAEQHRSRYPAASVVWVDSTTKLVQKAMTSTAGETTEANFTYGDPSIRDVFDLGVPQNAKVNDLRPIRDVTVLEDRLQRRFEAGFGDYVAVCAHTITASKKGKQLGVDRQIEIYAASGPAYLANSFPVGDADNHLFNVDPSALKNWPKPSIDMVLQVLNNKTPLNFLISNGKDIWQGYATVRTGIDSRHFTSDDAQTLPALQEMFTLPGALWPIRNLRLFGADCKAEIISDPAHPGLIGLKINRLYFMRAPDDARLAQMYWFDPAKDELPVESTEIYTSTKTDEIMQQFHGLFSDFVQTENGHWYPSRWKQEIIMEGSSETSWDNCLQVSTNKKLGAEWFAEPSAK